MLTAKDKQAIISLLKTINIRELHASETEEKRKWFRFGAYDALRQAVELIDKMPEKAKVKK